MEPLQALQPAAGEPASAACEPFFVAPYSALQQCLCSWDERLLSCPTEGIQWEPVLFFCGSDSLGDCLLPHLLFTSGFPLHSSPAPLLGSASADHDCSSLDSGAGEQADRHALPSLAPAHPRWEGGEGTGSVHENTSQRPLTSKPPSYLVPEPLFPFPSSPSVGMAGHI